MKSGELIAPSHDHKLMLDSDQAPFICNGCREVGFGARYRCKPCNFDLHTSCATTTRYISPPLHGNRVFQFFSRASGKVCHACLTDIKGYVYYFGDITCQLYLHPQCPTLSCELLHGKWELFLREKATSECNYCKRISLLGDLTGWSYVSASGKYHYHVNCMKKMIQATFENICSPYQRGKVGKDYALQNGTQTLEILPFGNSEKRGWITKWLKKMTRKKFLKTMKAVIQVIVSALCGDPTGIALTVFTSFVQS